VGCWEASGEVVDGCDGRFMYTRNIFSFRLLTQAVAVAIRAEHPMLFSLLNSVGT